MQTPARPPARTFPTLPRDFLELPGHMRRVLLLLVVDTITGASIMVDLIMEDTTMEDITMEDISMEDHQIAGITVADTTMVGQLMVDIIMEEQSMVDMDLPTAEGPNVDQDP